MVGNGVTQDEIIRVRRNPWADNFFRPLMITIMIMCLSVSVVNLVQLINPAWRGYYFLAGMLIVTIEAIYSYKTLRHYRMRGNSVVRYRLAEAIVLVLILKVLNFMGKSLPQISLEIQEMWRAPLAFVTVEFYMILFLAFLAWLSATYTMADLDALHDPYRDNRATLSDLANRFFWGGGILVVISGITKLIAETGARSLLDWQRPSLGGILLNVLIYFMVGLILLSQVNLTTHLVRWRIQKITVAPGLVKPWATYGFLFLGILTLVAFLLPTRYTLGLLATAGYAIQLLIGIILFLVQLLLLLILLPFNYLLGLLASSPVESASVPPPQFPPMFDAQDSAPMPGWLEVLRSLVFWLVALTAMGYMLKIYFDDHPEIAEQLKRFRFVGALIALVADIWRHFRGWAQSGLDMIPKRIKKREPGSKGVSAGQLWDWLGLRRLSPRERILYYYLNILKRAGQEGVPRKNHQTPFEFEPDLSKTTPEVQPEIHELTDIFVHARYSRAAFTEEQTVLVKALWQRVRRAFRGKALQKKRSEKL